MERQDMLWVVSLRSNYWTMPHSQKRGSSQVLGNAILGHKPFCCQRSETTADKIRRSNMIFLMVQSDAGPLL
jgi:hypothetical protein